MKEKIFLKIILGFVILVLLIKLLMIVFIEPLAGKKIEAELNGKNSNYVIRIDKVRILMISRGIELKSIAIRSKQEHGIDPDLKGEISSVKFRGINLLKAILKKGVEITEITISNSNIKGRIPFPKEPLPPIVFPFNIRIGSILFDKINLTIGNISTAQTFSVKNGVLKLEALQAEKQDTLSPGIIQKFQFEAEELFSVSADSMYSFKANRIIYSEVSNSLATDSFFIHPNYTDYDFTSRYEFQKDRIEARFSNINIHDFGAADYLRSRSLISSYIEIGKMDMKVFRDKRKKFQHVNKAAFQDLIYSYPGSMRIDSISLLDGNISYTEHAKEANEPGRINFNEISAKIYKITNDTLFKFKNAYLALKADALLMGKARLTVLLKGRLFDSHNTFSLSGKLSGLEANELNPMLEKNAFIYATSGKIDEMKFSFTANNDKATGKMIILYNELVIAVKNKRTDDTTALRERLISLIANSKVLDSNPIPGEALREGIISYNRDPEKFLLSYCAKSIISGIKSSLTKNPKKNND